ncbi:MAG: hypothetical protein H6704_10095 [Myxococcales bacterium]|nr:hypothetical protein [Myxococcales bacterium]
MGRLLLLLLLLGAGVAQAAPRKLAVLELRNRAEITAQEADYLTDVVRGVAAGLPAGDWFVMTRENILAVLPPGTDLAKCLEDATCDVEVGRALGADVAVFGDIVRFGKSLKVNLKLYDIAGGGRLLAQEAGGAPGIEALEAPVRGAAAALFDRLRPSATPPPAPPDAGVTLRRAPGQVEIVETLSKHHERMRRCYRRALETDRTLADAQKLLLFDITARGEVANLRLAPRHTALEMCLRSAAVEWRFRPFDGPQVPVEWPLTFKAETP